MKVVLQQFQVKPKHSVYNNNNDNNLYWLTLQQMERGESLLILELRGRGTLRFLNWFLTLLRIISNKKGAAWKRNQTRFYFQSVSMTIIVWALFCINFFTEFLQKEMAFGNPDPNLKSSDLAKYIFGEKNFWLKLRQCSMGPLWTICL